MKKAYLLPTLFLSLTAAADPCENQINSVLGTWDKGTLNNRTSEDESKTTDGGLITIGNSSGLPASLRGDKHFTQKKLNDALNKLNKPILAANKKLGTHDHPYEISKHGLIAERAVVNPKKYYDQQVSVTLVGWQQLAPGGMLIETPLVEYTFTKAPECALKRVNLLHPALNIEAADCLAISQSKKTVQEVVLAQNLGDDNDIDASTKKGAADMAAAVKQLTEACGSGSKIAAFAAPASSIGSSVGSGSSSMHPDAHEIAPPSDTSNKGL